LRAHLAKLNPILNKKKGIQVQIIDLETNLTNTYESIRKAADAINADSKTLLVREKSESNKGINTPFRGRYFIKILRNDLLPSPPAMEQELDDTKSPSIAAELARKGSELAYAK
jgi:hypothetical protein